ncbi:Diphthamide biosynthesis protein 2, partial [Linderina pennispora]
IEVFVLVACPEHSLVDSKEFYRPIVTPYELQLALSHTREWTGDYVTEFHEFLALAEEEAKSEDGGESADEGDSEPHFSLITGTLRQSKRYDSPRDTAALESAGGADVALRNQNTQVAQFLGSAGAEHLLARSFRGLGHDDNEDFSVNKDDPEPMLAVEGRSGIARGYTHEKGL